MKQYQVPQFINVEDRVVGPLTLRQFLYLLGGAAFGFIVYFSLQFVLFIIVMLPVSILTLLLAFFTINGQPFAKIATSALSFYTKPRLFVWQNIPRETKKAPIAGAEPGKTSDGKPGRAMETAGAAMPRPQGGKLSDLAWSLDIKEKAKR